MPYKLTLLPTVSCFFSSEHLFLCIISKRNCIVLLYLFIPGLSTRFTQGFVSRVRWHFFCFSTELLKSKGTGSEHLSQTRHSKLSFSYFYW